MMFGASGRTGTKKTLAPDVLATSPAECGSALSGEQDMCMRILGYVCVGLYILTLIVTSQVFGWWALILAAAGGVAAYYVDEIPLTSRGETGTGTTRAAALDELTGSRGGPVAFTGFPAYCERMDASDLFIASRPYPSFDELVEVAGVNEFTGPVRRIMLGFPLEPEFHDWLDEVTPAAQKRALRLELDTRRARCLDGLVSSGCRRPALARPALDSPGEPYGARPQSSRSL